MNPSPIIPVQVAESVLNAKRESKVKEARMNQLTSASSLATKQRVFQNVASGSRLNPKPVLPPARTKKNPLVPTGYRRNPPLILSTGIGKAEHDQENADDLFGSPGPLDTSLPFEDYQPLVPDSDLLNSRSAYTMYNSYLTQTCLHISSTKWRISSK